MSCQEFLNTGLIYKNSLIDKIKVTIISNCNGKISDEIKIGLTDKCIYFIDEDDTINLINLECIKPEKLASLSPIIVKMSSQFPNIKIKVKNIICNSRVTHVLTKEGNLFSWGEDYDKLGILGLGFNYVVKQPTLNMNILNKNIIDISLSESHCCCLVASREIYIWGTMYLDQTLFYNSPNLIKFKSNTNNLIYQHVTKVVCGENYSAFLNYTGQVFYIGKIKIEIKCDDFNRKNKEGNFFEIIMIPGNNFIDIIAGKNILCLKDTARQIFYYTESENLVKLQIQDYQNLKLIENNIYTYDTSKNIIYEIEKKKNNDKMFLHHINETIANNIKIKFSPYYTKHITFLSCVNLRTIIFPNKKNSIFSNYNESTPSNRKNNFNRNKYFVSSSKLLYDNKRNKSTDNLSCSMIYPTNINSLTLIFNTFNTPQIKPISPSHYKINQIFSVLNRMNSKQRSISPINNFNLNKSFYQNLSNAIISSDNNQISNSNSPNKSSFKLKSSLEDFRKNTKLNKSSLNYSNFNYNKSAINSKTIIKNINYSESKDNIISNTNSFSIQSTPIREVLTSSNNNFLKTNNFITTNNFNISNSDKTFNEIILSEKKNYDYTKNSGLIYIKKHIKKSSDFRFNRTKSNKRPTKIINLQENFQIDEKNKINLIDTKNLNAVESNRMELIEIIKQEEKVTEYSPLELENTLRILETISIENTINILTPNSKIKCNETDKNNSGFFNLTRNKAYSKKKINSPDKGQDAHSNILHKVSSNINKLGMKQNFQSTPKKTLIDILTKKARDNEKCNNAKDENKCLSSDIPLCNIKTVKK